MGQQPASRQVRIGRLQFGKPAQALQAFERRRNLPAHPIQPHHLRRRGLRRRQRGQQHHEAGGAHRARIRLLLLAAGLAPQPLRLAIRCCLRRAQQDQPCRQPIPTAADPHRVFHQLHRALRQGGEQIKPRPIQGRQGDRAPADAGDEGGALCRRALEVAPPRIATILPQHIARPHRHTAQGLGGAGLMHHQVGEASLRRLIACMQTPIAARAAVDRDRRAVHQGEPEMAVERGGGPAVAQQVGQHIGQEVAGVAQPFQ